MEWLIQVLKMFADFIPRPVLITPDQRVVIFLLGRWCFDCPPFMYVMWPIFWAYEVVQVSECVAETYIVIEGMKTRVEVVWHVIDARKSVTKSTDAEASITADAAGHLVAYDGDFDLEELNKAVARYGVEVLDIIKTSTGIPTIDVNG